jgi:hypothetical protein
VQFKVRGSSEDHMHPITELPKATVTGRAEKGAHSARLVVVINVEPLRLRAADGAAAFLASHHLVKLGDT